MKRSILYLSTIVLFAPEIGCTYVQSVRDGAPCDSDEACRNGQVCDVSINICVDPSAASSGEDASTAGSLTMDGDSGDPSTSTGDGDGDPSTTSGDGDEVVCGDGVVAGDEQCDDGNTEVEACEYGETMCTICDADCQEVPGATSYCGDGLTDENAGEACDDGAANGNGDSACTSTCEENVCGDGYAGPGEQCDDGAANGNGLSSCTSTCEDNVCGDDYQGPGEACDDGAANGNGLSPCTSTCEENVCGDGYQGPGEACDDGNVDDGDDCPSTCLIEGCGNNVVEEGEGCDDGNTDGGDGCSSACQLEVCGNNILDPAEGCDDGNTLTESCAYGETMCTVCDWACNLVDGVTSYCGDDVVDAVNGETCDVPEGWPSQTETCLSLGFFSGTVLCDACGLDTSACSRCGDGVVQALDGETCDDGAGVNGDGVSMCTVDCTLNECGDGYVGPGEVCDPVDGQGEVCSLDCQTYLGSCGDGVVAGDEWCDPGLSVTCSRCPVDGFEPGTIGSWYHPDAETNETPSRLGWSVASAGDVDGDGADDVIVGAPGAGAGAAFVFLSSQHAPPLPFTALGDSASQYGIRIDGVFGPEVGAAEISGVNDFGYSVASAGDVDGDGRDDVLVGAPRYALVGDTTNRHGKTYLFLATDLLAASSGSLTAPSASYAFHGGSPSDGCGASVASAGDVDGDGLDDVLIGCDDNSMFHKAAVYLSSSINAAAAGTEFSLSDADGYLAGPATRVTSLGDIDNDGLGDVAVGSPCESFTQCNGSVFVTLGSTIMGSSGGYVDLPIDAYWFQGGFGDGLGSAVTSAGDVDGDGREDLWISADRESGSGIAYIVLSSSFVGQPTGTSWAISDIAAYELTGDAGESVGESIATARLNFDTKSDLLISGRYDGGMAPGRVYLVDGLELSNIPVGSTVSLSSFPYSLEGVQFDEGFGASVASAGDFDNDGLDEILVGAPFSKYQSSTIDDGSAYIVNGP